MASTTVAHPEPESTTEPQPGYVLRGLGLFELHREEVPSGYQGGGRWLIPSGTVADRLYEVRVGVRRPSSCECRGVCLAPALLAHRGSGVRSPVQRRVRLLRRARLVAGASGSH